MVASTLWTHYRLLHQQTQQAHGLVHTPWLNISTCNQVHCSLLHVGCPHMQVCSSSNEESNFINFAPRWCSQQRSHTHGKTTATTCRHSVWISASLQHLQKPECWRIVHMLPESSWNHWLFTVAILQPHSYCRRWVAKMVTVWAAHVVNILIV